MCLNKNCCVPKVLITGYTVGATFALNTAYSFANTNNCDKLLIVFQASIPSQTTIVPVTVSTSSGSPAVLPLTNCLGNNIMSDQLVGIESLCIAFGSNTAHLRVLKAFDECGNEICLRPSAFYKTIEV